MKSGNKLAGLGLLTALSASLCCIAPILALLAGTTGAAANFSWIEPFRPYLIGLTLLVLGLAWYQKLKPAKQDCCATGKKERYIDSKQFLGVVTFFALAMLCFPYLPKVFDHKSETKQAAVTLNQSALKKSTLKIEGMTCESCEMHIGNALKNTVGIFSAKVSYADGNADIEFDSTKINLPQIEKVISDAGYSVIN